MFPKKSRALSLLFTPVCRFASLVESAVLGTVLLIPNGITLTLLHWNAKVGYKFTSHPFGMNENVIAEIVLKSKRKSV